MDELTTAQLRKHLRSVVSGDARLYSTVSHATGQIAGQVVDISEGGLQILCRLPESPKISPGDMVEIRFTLRDYPEEITVRGRVAHIEPDRVRLELIQSPGWQSTWQKILAFFAVQDQPAERFEAQGMATVYATPNRAECSIVDVSQSGLQIRSDLPTTVGSAVDVRFTPSGQSQEVAVTGRVARIEGDRIGIAFPQISAWQASWRKLVAFRTVSQRKQEGPLNTASLIEQVVAIQQEGAASQELSVKTAALWKMESLGVTFGRIAHIVDSLSDPSLPPEARPIVHVGMGGAAVELANFDRAEIIRIIDLLAHPDYRLFGYEQIGAMLGVYEKTAPRLILGLKRLDRPDPAKFIPLFPPEIQRLISHGYGRLLYFNSKDLRAALLNIRKREFLDLLAAVQGMAFGYAMVNHNDLGAVLETGDYLLEPALIAAFQSGLVYALEFWEWSFPGTLDSLRLPGDRTERLIRTARQEVADARQQGRLDPFVVKSGF